MIIVFTGTFKLEGEHVTRNLLIEVAEEHGHCVESHVNRATNMVVCGDTGRHGITKKLKEARQRGILVVSPTTFMDMMDG